MWLKDFANERGLEYAQDAAGNMVIRRPGTAGGEGAAPVIVQGHLDMVTENNTVVPNVFDTAPIRLLSTEGCITA